MNIHSKNCAYQFHSAAHVNLSCPQTLLQQNFRSFFFIRKPISIEPPANCVLINLLHQAARAPLLKTNTHSSDGRGFVQPEFLSEVLY